MVLWIVLGTHLPYRQNKQEKLMVKIHVRRIFGHCYLAIEEGKAEFTSKNYSSLSSARRAARIWQQKISNSEIVDWTK